MKSHVSRAIASLVVLFGVLLGGIAMTGCSSSPSHPKTFIIKTTGQHVTMHVGDYLYLEMWHTDWVMKNPTDTLALTSTGWDGPKPSQGEKAKLENCKFWAGWCGGVSFNYKAIGTGKVEVTGTTTYPEPATSDPNITCTTVESCGWKRLHFVVYVTVK